MTSLEKIQHYIQIDKDGYFNAQGVRVEDDEAGSELFDHLRHPSDDPMSLAWITEMDGLHAIVEAFDAPFVVQSIQRTSDHKWELTMPYGYKDLALTSSLTLDEWDRFHGVGKKGIPFVFSRKAQNDFFNQLDEFDDDSITVNQKRFSVGPWIQAHQESQDRQLWCARYQSNDTPWDHGTPSSALMDILPQIKILKSRILVLGCGRGHDAAHLAQLGHIVTAIDSSEVAIEQACKLYGDIKNLAFIQADALQLPENLHNSFDLVFEHTLYCAIDPKDRNRLVRSWRQCLTPDGYLLGIFFAVETPLGPPFGGSEWEIETRLGDSFKSIYWTRWKKSNLKRIGTELIVYAQKK